MASVPRTVPAIVEILCKSSAVGVLALSRAENPVPPPPVWPGAEDKPAAPSWDPDGDRPPPAAVPERQSSVGGMSTTTGNLEAGYVPPVRHSSMFDDCSCDCDISGAVSNACDNSKWVCRAYITFLLFLTILLSIIIVLVGLYAKTFGGALAGVLVGPLVLGGLQAFTFCSSDFEDEAGMWCYMTASTYWIFVITAFATCHTIVIVTAPNSLRNWYLLNSGKTFTGSIRDPEAFTGKYRFFNFTDAMFFPGSSYAPGQQNSQPQPTNDWYDYRCAKYSYKTFCSTPLVPLDYSFDEPITVWAGCSSKCGHSDTCANLMSGRTSSRMDCFQQWAKAGYGQPIYAYSHLNFISQFHSSKNGIGFVTAPKALYIRISNTAHVEDKKRRYKKYGVLTEGLVFGIFFGCCIITIAIVFIFS